MRPHLTGPEYRWRRWPDDEREAELSNLPRRKGREGILLIVMRAAHRTILSLSVAAACIGGLLVGGSCDAPSITRGGFASSAPAARAHAIKETVREAEAKGTLKREDLKQIVSLLMADDLMVRFMAINGLIQLTGKDLGYRFFDPPEVRFQAILRWRQFALDTNGTDRVKVVPPGVSPEDGGIKG